MKKTLFTIIFCLVHLLVFTQNCKLTGKLIDRFSGEPITYANAILTSSKDSTYLQGAITNNHGLFIIENVKIGSYNLKLSFIGYQSVQMNEVLLQRGTRDIGVIPLNVLTENLDAITVKATKASISYKVDKKVIDAGSFPGASVAMDLLENIPSLQVNFEGRLTYRGDGTFKVFINGHPVANGEEKLRQLPADKIDKIEVITNPSAKYDAEGTAGIIQVILKKNRLQGYAISTSAKASTFGSYQWLFSIDKKGERGGWYIGGQLENHIWSKMKVTEKQTITQENNLYQTNSVLDNKSGGIRSFLEFGFNYDLTDKDYINFSINANPLKSTEEHTKFGEISDLLYELSILSNEENYFFKSKSKLSYRYIGSTLTYKHAFNKARTHLLSSYISYSNYLHPLKEEKIDEKEYSSHIDKAGYRGAEHNEIIFEANVSYKNKLTELSSFEIGTEINLDHLPKVTSISGIFDNNHNLLPFSNEPDKQEVNFKQDIYATYLLFKSSWNKLEYQFGLRTELTDRKSNYSYLEDQNREILIPAEKQFLAFFPSFHTVYNFSETHQLAVNYSRRISRPNYWKLIPLSQYSSPYTYYKGNGNLVPTYSNAFEMAYTKSWGKDFIGMELFARNNKNIIQNYSHTGSDNILFYSPENIGDSWSAGAEFMVGVDIYSWWNMNVSSSLYSYKLFVNIDSTNKTESQLKNDTRLNNTFLLPKAFTVKWDLNYKSPTVAVQRKRDGYFYSNFAVKKDFNDKKWQFTLSYSDIFSTKKYKSKMTGIDFNIENDYVLTPFLSFKISYNFDNQK